jgi:PAS domain S-box-containing protein
MNVDQVVTAAEFRQRAEEISRETIAQMPEDLAALSPEATPRTLHELRVHQIELELQDEELRRAQVELEAARARYFDLYDLAPVGYCTVSEPGVILEANLTLGNLLGVARGALVEQPLARFIVREDADIFYLLNKQLLATQSADSTSAPQASLLFRQGGSLREAASAGQAGRSLSCELQMMRGDGTAFWAHLEATAAQDPSTSSGQAAEGTPTVRLVLSDVTTRKQAEAALRESEEQHRAILQAAMAGFWLVDTQGHLLEVNEAYCRMSGYSVDELLTMRISQLEAAETATATAAHIQKVLAGGGNRFESRHQRKDGSVFDVEISFQLRPVDGGQLVVFVDDITARKRAQVELNAERAHYFGFYNLAPVGFVTVSEPGVILEANLPLATLLNVAPGSLPQQPLSGFVFKEDADRFHLLHQQLFRTGESQSCELRMVKHAGPPFWVQLAATIVQAGGDAPVSRMVLSDITARKQAEAEHETLAAQTRHLQKVEGLDRMAGAIVHHFNNQLMAVMGNLELAMNDLSNNSGPGMFLTNAMQSARKAAEVSGAMLTYLGQSMGKQQPLDFSGACHQSLPLLRAALPPGVALETDLPSPGPSIRANANQIRQMLTNLVTNAWESMGDGQGVIRLTVKTVSPAEMPTAGHSPIAWQPHASAYVCLEVADAGCGIPDEDIEKLFDPFFSRKFTGRGLGLSTVLGIVRALDGTVTVESEPGRGSVFRVFLPLLVAGASVKGREGQERGPGSLPSASSRDDRQFQPLALAAPIPPPVPRAPKRAGGATLLVVEDEPGVREVVTRALERFGFSVLVAEDGVAAMEVFRLHRDEIDCVLCDVSMPRMNGWETLTELRKLSPGIPVILASGYSEALVMEGHHSALPQTFLNKPYQFDALIHAIGQILPDAAPIRAERENLNRVGPRRSSGHGCGRKPADNNGGPA